MQLFRVPPSALYLEVFGDDSEGALLLGVFLLPEPAVVEDGQPHHLSVTLEGGQTVAMEIALAMAHPGDYLSMSFGSYMRKLLALRSMRDNGAT